MTRRRGAAGALAAALLISLIVFAAFRTIPILAAAEASARDLVHAEFYPETETRGDIVLVMIEETTLTRFPYRSPIDRAFLAELIGGLAALGPKAIGLDLLIDQPTEPEKDFALLDAIEPGDGPPVVVVVADEADGLTVAQTEWLGAATEGAHVAQAALLHDPFNDAVRAAPATRQIAGRQAPSFAVALARAAGLAASDDGFEIAFAPTGAGIDFTPRYVAGFHQYLTEEQIGGRIAMIGVLLSGADRHRTPLDIITDGEETPGVEAHAQALAQIIDGRRLFEVGIGAELALTALAAVLIAAALALPAGVAVQALAAAIVLAGFAAAPALALGEASLRLPALAPPIAGALTGAAIAFARWRVEARVRKRLREAFGRFVSPDVVKEIEARPEALRLGGERREVTCVFTDVAGFTTLCEGMEANELCDLLNRYLGGASEVVIRHGGTIDKFVGDAVVCFFGAPIARPDHAAAAIRMAVALDDYAMRFVAAEARAGRAFGITRIGVHSGEATIGNFGGDLFFDYTAIGDTVNVAARLEGANKAFGGRLCISGDALEAAGGALEGVVTRPIGHLRVKGRAAPLATFEAFAPDDPRAATLGRYCEAFGMLECAPEDAVAAFEALAAAAPDDGLVTFHARRLATGERGVVITLKEK